MASERTGPLERLRRPEYTGSNRCLPCTAVNIALAVALSAAVAVASLPAAPVVFALSVAAIYFRGYLVPGTPTLTKRYFPDWLLAAFDKGPSPAAAAADTNVQPPAGPTHEEDPAVDSAPASIDPERVFLEHRIVVPCTDGEDRTDADQPTDDVCLPDPVRSAWQTEIDVRRDGDRRRQVARFLETDPEAVTIDRRDERVSVRVDERLVGRWESEPALLADLAGAQVLADQIPDWNRRPLAHRSRLANGLRAFLERCPRCNGPVSLGEETVESCCRSQQVYAITCDDCEARLLEAPR
ncbi:hypothetical protein [Halopiger xanaduensis]|uniref:Uncharacterized protein n=1 Tax=Halopiger xanaduensis (strain DSM 18323 / JCM 14033 / SH-6) TaxID=797210 RepID=F8D6V7_HALXS|nr:hypothetical protein [Halopiger xanaduensis]AEH35919.1 hypothetical protein Halxa_1286 [Halopiger xanaduensis SH-6]